MPLGRYARKVDLSQKAIVEGLRALHYRVYLIGEPCDLLVYGWSNKRQCFRWQTLELKTPTKTGKRRKRTDQIDQQRFLEDTRTPVVLTLEDAIRALENA